MAQPFLFFSRFVAHLLSSYADGVTLFDKDHKVITISTVSGDQISFHSTQGPFDVRLPNSIFDYREAHGRLMMDLKESFPVPNLPHCLLSQSGSVTDTLDLQLTCGHASCWFQFQTHTLYFVRIPRKLSICHAALTKACFFCWHQLVKPDDKTTIPVQNQALVKDCKRHFELRPNSKQVGVFLGACLFTGMKVHFCLTFLKTFIHVHCAG